MKLRLVCICVTIVVLFSQICTAGAFTSDETIRVGLYYGSSAMVSANLQNYIGSGYKFGYYDKNKSFVAEGTTSGSKITVMKNANVYLSSAGTYYDSVISSPAGTVGGYHLQSSQIFYTYSDAKKYADSITVAHAFPSYINGVFRIRLGSYTSESAATSAKSSLSSSTRDTLTVVSPSTTCYTVTTTGTATIIFEFDQGGQALGILPISSSDKAQTWFKGYKYYGGFSYNRLTGGNLTVINYVSMDDYIKGVIPYEMSASWNLEALKAQAICARSYAYNNLNKHDSYGFDLCNSTDCQVYKGTNSATENSNAAVDDTSGEYMTYDGKIATGFYHSSDGGATENSENVWSAAVGYLRGVSDPYEDGSKIPNYNWTVTLTNDKVASILKSKGYSLTGVKDMYISKFTDMGNVYQVTIIKSDGTKIQLEKSAVRTVLTSSAYDATIKSMRYHISGGSTSSTSDSGSFYINSEAVTSMTGLYAIGSGGTAVLGNLNGNYAITDSGTEQMSGDSTTTTTASTGTYTISGTGWGHNVGMSQYGAKAMADKGYDYKTILKFYYTGISINSN